MWALLFNAIQAGNYIFMQSASMAFSAVFELASKKVILIIWL
jgi:hypothetical protein